MDVRIEQVTSTVESVDASALLSPAVLARIVDTVIARLEEKRHDAHQRARELDTRSVVEQQRDERW